MKFLSVVTVIAFCVLLLVSCHRFLGQNEMSPKRKMAFKMISEIVQEITIEDGLYFSGVSEAAPEGKYRRLGIKFVSTKILTREEGRRLIIKCLNKMLAKFNGNPEFSQYIEKGKFTFEDLGASIVICLSDGSEVYYPDITAFSFSAGNLRYCTDAPNVRGYYTKEEETYEEALRLVNEGKSSGL